jgi:capsular polysaccharide export protein
LFWPGGAHDYRGSPEGFEAEVRDLIMRECVTDVLLFGDCRPYHQAAMRACTQTGVRVHVFEEGYLRPFWITLEENGTNGMSGLPREPKRLRELAKRLGSYQAPDETITGGGRRRFAYEIASYAISLLGRRGYPHYRFHRPYPPMSEFRSWGLKLLKRPAVALRSRRVEAALAASGRPFFLLPLQLDSDYQIKIHSGFGSMQTALRHVMAAFAADAPPELALVVKRHPLDNGIVDMHRLTHAIAGELGVADRVFFIDGGHLPTFLKMARGLVTVNSTSGLQALHHDCPTIALGNAIYDVPGLTHQDGLKSFWNDPAKPQHSLYAAYRRVVMHLTQCNGNYNTRRGIALGVRHTVDRLEGATVASPAAQPAVEAAARSPAEEVPGLRVAASPAE